MWFQQDDVNLWTLLKVNLVLVDKMAMATNKLHKFLFSMAVVGMAIKLINGRYIVQNCINQGKIPMISKWLFYTIINIFYRSLLLVYNLPSKFVGKYHDDHHDDILFVQGALIPPPDRFPMNLFWNPISHKGVRSPVMGPLSRMNERAIQLFNSIQAFKDIKLIAHSAGCNTVLKLIEYLHYHHLGMIKLRRGGREGGREGGRDVDYLYTNPNYKVIFVDEYGKGLDVSPKCISKVVLVSPPLAGAELLLNEYPEVGNKWTMESVVLFMAHGMQMLIGDKSMMCLGHIQDRYKHATSGKNIFKDLTPDKAKQDTELGLRLCKMYNIEVKRVITHHSEAIYEKECIKPSAHPALLVYMAMGVYGNKHDGLITLDSQRYMLDCDCEFNGDIYKCEKCGTIYANIDHFSISIASTHREIPICREVWKMIMNDVTSFNGTPRLMTHSHNKSIDNII